MLKKSIFLCMTLAMLVFANHFIPAAGHATSSEEQMKQQKEESGRSGESLFRYHCAVCHPDGGNIINPAKTLRREDRDKFGIKTAEDIIKLMRNPGTGMRLFDENTLSEPDSKKIADHILKTY